ncbi:MAG: polysaccharide biosynthesis/export family protein [Pirellulales bacterium]|nr:polysaccharide biosynthesis/export family protein [Pirellulales bacterium]
MRNWCCIKLIVGSWLLIVAISGCAQFRETPPPPLQGPILDNDHAAIPIGRELDMLSLPRYTIEPPDVLTIEVVRIIPKSPYRLQPLDSVQINVQGTLPDSPIGGQFFIDHSGAVQLGPTYGKVTIAGLPVEEASEVVERYLRRTLRDPQVSLSLAESAGLQQITGTHQVGPDGKVNLGTYGTVGVTGLTIPEAKQRIEEHLENYLENPQVSLDIFSYASKSYYVITAGAGNGDNIQKFPITGNERVLDAIVQINGISQFSSKTLWIARPTPAGDGCDTILPVDYEGIVAGGRTATNYQILPGDRLFIEEDHLQASNTFINKLINPFERILGFTLLGFNTTGALQRFPGGFRSR